MVSQKEIIEALRAYDKAMGECGYELSVDKTIADRIEAEGIAPPDGFAIVRIDEKCHGMMGGKPPKGVSDEQ